MAKKEEKKGIEINKAGAVFKATPTLCGKTVKLMRGGKEVTGVLMSKDKQGPSDNLAFKWKDTNGVHSISEVTGEELEKIKNG